jgi:hypothetical protein
MSFFSSNGSVQPACTNNVHRPMGGIAGLREVYDDVGRLTVSAFPMTMVKDLALTKAATAACYILADHATAYIGETGNLGRRLSDHAADPAKAFAREVYVVSGYERAWFDKTAAVYLQYRLTEIAEQAGLVEVVRGVNPQVLELPGHRRASLDRFVEHGERQLFDAGCRVFRSNFASQRRALQATDSLEATVEPDESGPMQIGVVSTPPLGSELELAYGDLWARGYGRRSIIGKHRVLIFRPVKIDAILSPDLLEAWGRESDLPAGNADVRLPDADGPSNHGLKLSGPSSG